MVSIVMAVGIGSIFIGWNIHKAAKEIVDILHEIRNAINANN